MKGPLCFKPFYQTYVWGGDRIVNLYRRPDALGPIAESWEISDRDEGMSISKDGKTLRSLLHEMGEQLVGKGRNAKRFPLLVKIIDARESLSIQVHPNERSAPVLGAEPKTECWYALAPSTVYLGFKEGFSIKKFREKIESGTLPDELQRLDLAVGEVAYLPGGTVHAILGESLLFEVQQNSHTTYRLYDWGRSAKSRPLHIEEGLQAIELNNPQSGRKLPFLLEKTATYSLHRLIHTPYFSIEKVVLEGNYRLRLDPSTFLIVFCEQGSGELVCDGIRERLEPGTTLLLPASAKEAYVQGHLHLIQIRQPQDLFDNEVDKIFD